MGLCTAAAVLIADQVSKYYILNAVLEDRAMIIYTSWFNLVKAWNTGVSFSMFNDKGFWGVVMLSALAAGIIAFLLWWLRREPSRLLQVALGFIIGGAVGNLIDRIRTGVVVDYLNCLFINFPVFNFADVCICVGVGLLVLSLLLDMRREQKAKQQKGSAPTDGTA